jgi:hypothetical protein
MSKADVILYGSGPIQPALRRLEAILESTGAPRTRIEAVSVVVKDRAGWALMGWAIWESE